MYSFPASSGANWYTDTLSISQPGELGDQLTQKVSVRAQPVTNSLIMDNDTQQLHVTVMSNSPRENAWSLVMGNRSIGGKTSYSTHTIL